MERQQRNAGRITLIIVLQLVSIGIWFSPLGSGPRIGISVLAFVIAVFLIVTTLNQKKLYQARMDQNLNSIRGESPPNLITAASLHEKKQTQVSSNPTSMDDVQVSHGCPHLNRPAKELCLECGKGICYECVFVELLEERFTGKAKYIVSGPGGYAGGGGFSTAKDYGAFCASCFLKRTSNPNYYINAGVDNLGMQHFIMTDKAPGFIGLGSPFASHRARNFFALFFLSIFSAGIVLILVWPIVIHGNFIMKKYRNFIEQRGRAQYIYNQMQSI